MENVTLSKKTIFISYCHKDINQEWIDKLAIALGQNGIESIVDIYDLQLGQDLNYFMEQIKKVDKVLILLGKTYKEKANDRDGGVGTETQIISNDVYCDVEQTKFIPIVINKDENGKAYLPYYLESRLYTDFSNDNLFAENLDELVRQIHHLPKRKKPVVVEPSQYLIQSNTNMGILLIKNDVRFNELEAAVIEEMAKMNCTYNEYEQCKDDIIVKKIEDSKEVRDIFIKVLYKMISANTFVVEDLVVFLEKAYHMVHLNPGGNFYDSQNDASKFFLHEIIIYILTILYQLKRYEVIYRLMKTTYFPESTSNYVRSGIRLDDFFENLDSLQRRNTRLELNRSSLRADLLMQRASIPDLSIDFSMIRFTDSLIFMLSEWFFKKQGEYLYWYPVTLVYNNYNFDYLQIKKYLVSKSRYEVISELFGNISMAEFIKRYDELTELVRPENRNFLFGALPSLCTIIKRDELFSKE